MEPVGLEYETNGNGFTIEIFEVCLYKGRRKIRNSIDFYQGEAAGFLVRALENTQSDEEEQDVLTRRDTIIANAYDSMMGY